METIWELIMTYVPPIVGVIIFLLVAYAVAGWIGRLVTRALARARVERTLCKFAGSCG